jgi:hypothetical protein
MSTPLVRKVDHDRSCCSVVGLHGVCQVYATVVSRIDGTLREQVRDALEAIATAMGAEGAQGAVIQQTVFLVTRSSGSRPLRTR